MPAPLRRRLRRLLQFRLRTLLILLTLTCLWLGWSVHQARKQRVNVEFLRANYGTVTYEWELDPSGQSPLGRWLSDLLGPDMVYDVVGVETESLRYVTSPLRAMPEIEMPRELMTCLDSLPALRRLRLDHLEIGDAELPQISRLTNLEFLSIQYAREVTDAGLAHLASLPKLQHLVMDYTSVTQDGIDRLQQALPQCRIEW